MAEPNVSIGATVDSRLPGTLTKKDIGTSTAGYTHHQILVPTIANSSNGGSNRNSISSVNTFGQVSEMHHLPASALISYPPSSPRQRLDSTSSSFRNVRADRMHESDVSRRRPSASRDRVSSHQDEHYVSTTSSTALSSQETSTSAQPSIDSRKPLPSSSGVTCVPLSMPAQPPGDMGSRAARDERVETGAGVGTGAGAWGLIGEGSRGMREGVISNEGVPWNLNAGLHVPQFPYDPAALESEINALKYQIRQTTIVLTHVVQTKSVPSPTALLNLSQQDTHHHQGKQSSHEHQMRYSKQYQQTQHQQQQQRSATDCSCALLQARDDGKFGTGREATFLAACYCPDPWEFQNRVLRQVELMQQELHTLKQEMLEIERRATMRMRQEMLEWERGRDKEWVELNERLRNALFAVEDDGDDNATQQEGQQSGSGIVGDVRDTLQRCSTKAGEDTLDEDNNNNKEESDVCIESTVSSTVEDKRMQDKGKGKV
ncbi:hypothetical protein BGZ58_008628 [Dissophora ornata]|nr:hypothetical protein BGZ58_008628 [Dissophora ornata]